jgi:hypothetical protein
VKPNRLVSAVAVCLFALGCSDSTGPGGLTGTVTFNYTGGGGGTFNVSGRMPTIAADAGDDDWAAGFRDNPNSQISIAGARARTAGRYDLAFIGIGRLAVGTENVDANCEPDLEVCTGLVLLIDISEADDSFAFICALGTGSIAITEITSTRVRGSFSGTGACANGSVTSFTVTGGTFDVPLVPNFPI